MAKLKPFTYLTLEETKEWLKIKDSSYDNILIRLINTATDMVEAYIDGPALTREYTEFRDGNSSTTLVPIHFPVKEIVSIKIDYNRNFAAAPELAGENIIIRGIPSMDQIIGTPVLEINGTDIVFRDDRNTSIIGRMFAGSVIQSIQLVYKAGRGQTADDLPASLVQATLMLVEYLYTLKENRDLNIRNKSSMGQNYSRNDESGIPKEIQIMLNEFRDVSFGGADVPTRNIFSI